MIVYLQYLLVISSVPAFVAAFRYSKLHAATKLHSTATGHDHHQHRPCAILFDCDGVIVETEELHRLAFNEAFQHFQLQLPNKEKVTWDAAFCKFLLIHLRIKTPE